MMIASGHQYWPIQTVFPFGLMQVVQSSFISLILVGLVLFGGARVALIVIFALLPMGMMAAVNLPAIGNTSVLAIDLAVIALLFSQVARPGGMVRLAQFMSAAFLVIAVLLALLLYATLATLFFPRIFAGETEVFSLSRTVGQKGIVSGPLRPGTGNLSQLLRLYLAVAAFFATAMVVWRWKDPGLIYKAVGAATLVHVGMGFFDLAAQATGTNWLLGWARTANYSLTLGQELAGLNRMIGGYPEASSYGYLSLGLLGFWLSWWMTDRSRSIVPTVMLLLVAFVVLRGTSTSAYVGAAVFFVIFLGQRMSEIQSSDGNISRRGLAMTFVTLSLLPFMIIVGYSLYQMVPSVTEFVDRSLLDKLSSDSGIERMSWNAQALRNFVDTNLLGAGLGSVRASNWVCAALGTLGLPGFLLMCWFLWQVFSSVPRNSGDHTQRIALALKMALVGFLARAVVVKASPNLDISFFAMAGVVVGLAASSAVAAKRRPAPRTVTMTRLPARSP